MIIIPIFEFCSESWVIESVFKKDTILSRRVHWSQKFLYHLATEGGFLWPPPVRLSLAFTPQIKGTAEAAATQFNFKLPKN